MNNPLYVKINDKKYKINTDFKVALKCQEVANDSTINDIERALAIIYLLFGDDGLEDTENYDLLIEKAQKYLSCGEEVDNTKNDKPDMDLLQDYRLIQASFKSDYGIDLEKANIHWWDFYTYLNGLTDKCVLNRIRELRTFDLSQIKDPKEKRKYKEMQERWKLKEKEKPLTEKQQEAVNKFYELTGIKRKE